MTLELNEIQAITDEVWLPGSYDNWSKGNVLMHKLLMDKLEKIGSGEYVRAVLEHAKARGGPMGAATQFDTAKKAVINAARFPWAYFWSGTTIDIKDETQISGGDADVDVVLTKLDNVQKSIRTYMGDSLWEDYATQQASFGSETEPFYGVDDMLNSGSDTSPAFGRIDRADLGTSDQGTNIWLPYTSAAALTMNFATMQTLRRGCSVNNSVAGKPSLYVTTETLKDAFENSLQAAQRHHNADLVEAGFDNIEFGHVPMVADDRCPASNVNGFNMEYLYLKAHRDFHFAGPVWKSPTNMHIKTSQIIWSGSFCTSQRRAQGRLTNVS